ncbi:MAG: hypothetical protein ACLFTH_02850 [Candidatus Woesearchaeota archaeon]
MVVLASLASATSIDVEPVNQTSHQIFFDETAVYKLSIDNSADTSKVFSISMNPLNWIIDSSRNVVVDANSTETFELRVRPRPTNFRGPGVYRVPLEVTTTDGDELQDNVKIVIKSIEERLFEYKPSIALGVSLDEKVNPQDSLSVQVGVRNRNLRNLENVSLELDAEHFSGEKTFSLSSLEERSLAFRFDVDNNAAPGTYELFAKLVYDNETINEVERYYDIVPYADIDRDRVNSSSRFFKSTRVMKVTNTGNVNKSVVTDLDISLLEDIFTGVDVEASTVERLSRNSWKVVLNPGETATITVVKNFRSLAALGLIAVVAVILYFTMRSPLTLKKQVIVTGKDDEGVSEMKVRIYLRNRTGKAFYNLRLLDKAPAIAQVSPNKAIGSIEPTKIVKTEHQGTIVKWDFDSLEAYEERIVTYTIRARLKIIGNLGLPKVKVRFENVKGKTRTTESARATIGATS